MGVLDWKTNSLQQQEPMTLCWSHSQLKNNTTCDLVLVPVSITTGHWVALLFLNASHWFTINIISPLYLLPQVTSGTVCVTSWKLMFAGGQFFKCFNRTNPPSSTISSQLSVISTVIPSGVSVILKVEVFAETGDCGIRQIERICVRMEYLLSRSMLQQWPSWFADGKVKGTLTFVVYSLVKSSFLSRSC